MNFWIYAYLKINYSNILVILLFFIISLLFTLISYTIFKTKLAYLFIVLIKFHSSFQKGTCNYFLSKQNEAWLLLLRMYDSNGMISPRISHAGMINEFESVRCESSKSFGRTGTNQTHRERLEKNNLSALSVHEQPVAFLEQ